jgi:hypothetical protein
VGSSPTPGASNVCSSHIANTKKVKTAIVEFP